MKKILIICLLLLVIGFLAGQTYYIECVKNPELVDAYWSEIETCTKTNTEIRDSVRTFFFNKWISEHDTTIRAVSHIDTNKVVKCYDGYWKKTGNFICTHDLVSKNSHLKAVQICKPESLFVETNCKNVKVPDTVWTKGYKHRSYWIEEAASYADDKIEIKYCERNWDLEKACDTVVHFEQKSALISGRTWAVIFLVVGLVFFFIPGILALLCLIFEEKLGKVIKRIIRK